MHQPVKNPPNEAWDELDSRVAALLRRGPEIDPSAWLAPDVAVVGAVEIGPRASLWPGVVVRADLAPITIGEDCNLQDGVVVHVADDGPVRLGRGVSCGHRAVVHACEIGDHCLIGMGAVVMDGAVLGRHCLVAAGAVVPKGMQVPEGSLVAGLPGRVVRPLGDEERRQLVSLAEKYVRVSAVYRRHPEVWPAAQSLHRGESGSCQSGRPC